MKSNSEGNGEISLGAAKYPRATVTKASLRAPYALNVVETYTTNRD